MKCQSFFARQISHFGVHTAAARPESKNIKSYQLKRKVAPTWYLAQRGRNARGAFFHQTLIVRERNRRAGEKIHFQKKKNSAGRSEIRFCVRSSLFAAPVAPLPLCVYFPADAPETSQPVSQSANQPATIMLIDPDYSPASRQINKKISSRTAASAAVAPFWQSVAGIRTSTCKTDGSVLDQV